MKKITQLPFILIGTLFLFIAGFLLWIGGVVSFSEVFLDDKEINNG